MKSNDLINQKKDELREAMQNALQKNDTDGFYTALNQMMQAIGDEIRQDYDGQMEQMKNERDSQVLTCLLYTSDAADEL